MTTEKFDRELRLLADYESFKDFLLSWDNELSDDELAMISAAGKTEENYRSFADRFGSDRKQRD